MSQSSIPSEMSAVVLDSYSGAAGLRVEKRPVPRPGPNQVLIKVAASPINPSDLMFMEGKYGFTRPTPTVPGFEGSGVVVAHGGGIMGRFLDGKRVACINAGKGEGIWSDYVVVPVINALPLSKEVSIEQGAMSAVNPLTAIGFLSVAQAGRHKAIVHTAAASALGQMVVRLFKSAGIDVINVVRRDAQVELLQVLGAKYVLNSSDADFDKQLAELSARLKARLAFDAVAGELTMRVAEAMPKGSRVSVYGGLSLEPSQVTPGALIFQNKVIDGFWLTSWFQKKNMLQALMLWRRAQRLMLTDLATNVRQRFPLEAAQEAVRLYEGQMTGGKVLFVPGS